MCIGLDAKYINCDDTCSPDINDSTETYRWFHHVLPQLRDFPVNKSCLPLSLSLCMHPIVIPFAT